MVRDKPGRVLISILDCWHGDDEVRSGSYNRMSSRAEVAARLVHAYYSDIPSSPCYA